MPNARHRFVLRHSIPGYILAFVLASAVTLSWYNWRRSVNWQEEPVDAPSLDFQTLRTTLEGSSGDSGVKECWQHLVSTGKGHGDYDKVYITHLKTGEWRKIIIPRELSLQKRYELLQLLEAKQVPVYVH